MGEEVHRSQGATFSVDVIVEGAPGDAGERMEVVDWGEWRATADWER